MQKAHFDAFTGTRERQGGHSLVAGGAASESGKEAQAQSVCGARLARRYCLRSQP